MEQDIRFCDFDGKSHRLRLRRRGPIAPVRVAGGSRTSRRSGRIFAARGFFEELARTHRVVRYDRLGAGLSERARSAPLPRSPRTRHSRPCSTPARSNPRRSSPARARVSRRPPRGSGAPRVHRIVFFGGYVSRTTSPMRRGVARRLPRVNWMLAAQMLAGLFVPTAAGTRSRRSAATCDTRPTPSAAAAFLELELASDARPSCRRDARARPPPPRGPHRPDRPRAASSRPFSPTRASSPWAATRICPGTTTSATFNAPSLASSPTRADPRDERRLAADSTRDRSPAPCRRRTLEPRDRLRARPQRAHGAPPRREPPAGSATRLERRRRHTRRAPATSEWRSPRRATVPRVHATHVRSASVAVAR